MYAATFLGLAFASTAQAGTPIAVTPQDEYGSAIGVLGCKIDVDRVAYWPGWPDCNNICVQVTYEGRTLNLLRIDTSASDAYDISYDAWNYLAFGEPASVDPEEGGAIEMEYENVDMSNCLDLITDGSEVLSYEAQSLNFILSCPAGSWAAENYQFYNIYNDVCTYGIDEECSLEGEVMTCPHQVGIMTPLTTHAVYNCQYGTGIYVLATA